MKYGTVASETHGLSMRYIDDASGQDRTCICCMALEAHGLCLIRDIQQKFTTPSIMMLSNYLYASSIV
jgi:hypothetical protein